MDDLQRSQALEGRLLARVTEALSATLCDEVTPILAKTWDLGAEPPHRATERLYTATTADTDGGIVSAQVSVSVSLIPGGPMSFALGDVTTETIPAP